MSMGSSYNNKIGPPSGDFAGTNNDFLDKKDDVRSMLNLNATGLLQSGYFNRLGASIARPYAPKTSQVCSLKPPVRVSKTNNRLARIYKEPIEGLYYNKVPKTASSTLAGINQRIAVHWGHRLYAPANRTRIYPQRNTTCSHKQAHIIGAGKYYGSRVNERSFLWGSIRDPASRALSRVFFFHVSQDGFSDDDETVLKFLREDYNHQTGTISKGRGGFQLQYLSLDHLDEWYAWNQSSPTVVQNHANVEDAVRNVIQKYDFISITERMEESLVAMQLLLGLRVGDILSTSAKIGGGYFYDRNKDVCIPIQRTKQSPAVKDYFNCDEWQAVNYGDYLLYAAANQSLDLTIERLGRDRFTDALQVYREAQRIVNQECSADAHFPCSADGKVQLKLSQSSCYTDDEGCGYACIDHLVKERGW